MADISSEGDGVDTGQLVPAVEQGRRIRSSAGQWTKLGNRAAGSGHGQALACMYAIYDSISAVLELLNGYFIHAGSVPHSMKAL